MNLLFFSTADDPDRWIQELTARVPDLKGFIWPDVPDKSLIDAALVWKPPPGLLKEFPNLKLILSLGMGVDHILKDPTLLPDIPIARLVDTTIVTQMGEYVCHAVLHHHRHMEDYAHLHRERRWRPLPPADTAERRVGILGLGTIGSHTARLLVDLGFSVRGWSRTPKCLNGVECFHGEEGFIPFLQRTDILVCLLPLTEATRSIIDVRTLTTLPAGAYVINCARGGHLVEEDLLKALDQGHIAGATLDVFRQEPLPPEHPFWTHPKIRITPHIAGLTIAETGAPQVAENLRRLQTGEPILNRVHRDKGY